MKFSTSSWIGEPRRPQRNGANYGYRTSVNSTHSAKSLGPGVAKVDMAAIQGWRRPQYTS